MVPKIGTTESIDCERKTIHEIWSLPSAGFYWLIAEREGDEAFGFANLNDGYCAEWGYISIAELLSCGAAMVYGRPVPFTRAKTVIEEALKKAGAR